MTVGAGELRSSKLISLVVTIFMGSRINFISNTLITSLPADKLFVNKIIVYLLKTTKFGLEFCHFKFRFLISSACSLIILAFLCSQQYNFIMSTNPHKMGHGVARGCDSFLCKLNFGTPGILLSLFIQNLS